MNTTDKYLATTSSHVPAGVAKGKASDSHTIQYIKRSLSPREGAHFCSPQ